MNPKADEFTIGSVNPEAAEGRQVMPKSFVPSRALCLPLAGLLLAWGLPVSGLPSMLFSGVDLAARTGRELTWWAFGLVMLLWIARVERLPLSSIGLRRPTLGSFGWGLLFVVPMIASVMVSYAVIFPALGLHQNMAATRSLIAVPLWLQTATMLRAGVVEEILYRGYPIERLTALTGRRWLAALLSASVFIVAHIGAWGYAQLVVVTFGAAILTGLYLWRRDLPACMIAHALTDIIGFALARAQT
ncbi:MAG: CPBP family intramembrane glutamic endopeptidase [Janthinobacterium lividum]